MIARAGLRILSDLCEPFYGAALLKFGHGAISDGDTLSCGFILISTPEKLHQRLHFYVIWNWLCNACNWSLLWKNQATQKFQIVANRLQHFLTSILITKRPFVDGLSSKLVLIESILFFYFIFHQWKYDNSSEHVAMCSKRYLVTVGLNINTANEFLLKCYI